MVSTAPHGTTPDTGHGPRPAPAAEERAAPLAVWLALIMLLGTALRAFRLGYQSLWFDEVLTIISSMGSVARVLTQTEVNTLIPPLYYLLINRALSVSGAEAMVRLPSLVVGSLSILLCFLVMRPWLGQRLAVASALLLAISPFHVWHSQDARPYAFFLFLALLSLWCFQQVRQHPHRPAWKVGFVLATAATAMTHTVAIGFFALLAALVLIHADAREWRRWLPLGLGVIVLSLPALQWLAAVVLEHLPRTPYLFDPFHFAYTAWTLATGYSLGPSVAELHGDRPELIALQYLWIVAPVAVLFGALLLLGALRLWKDNRSGLRVLLLWLLVPVMAAVLGAALTGHPFNVRYAILALPPFLALVAAGAEALRIRPLRAGAWCLLVLTMGLSLSNHYFDPRYHREDTRAAAAVLRERALPWETVIVSAPYTALTLQYYLGPAEVQLLRYQTVVAGPAALSTVYGTPEDASLSSEAEQLAAQLRRLGEEKGSYWLFLSRTFHGDHRGHLVRVSNALFQQDLEFRAPGVYLARYIVPPPSDPPSSGE